MRCVLIKEMPDGTKTEEYLRCTYKKADDRFYDQLFATTPKRIELWKINRKGELCKLLNICVDKDSDPELQQLFEQIPWAPKSTSGMAPSFVPAAKSDHDERPHY